MGNLTLKGLKVRNNSEKTVKECYTEYMEYCKSIGQRHGTLESKENFFKYELPKVVNVDDNISTLTEINIKNHINEMIDKGFKGNYYQTFVIKLKAFLTFCFRHFYLKEFDVKIPSIQLSKKEIYTEEEIIKLLKKPDLNKCLVGDYRSWAIVNFFMATGCRTETLLNIKVEDIKFNMDYILFRHMKTKNQHTVPISDSLKVVLKEYISNLDLKDSDYLFPKIDKSKMKYDTLHQNLSNYFKHCNVKFHGINTFRNTFATMFIKNGGDIYRLKSILCHANIKTTERYINLLPLELKEDTLKFNPLDILNKNTLKIKR